MKYVMILFMAIALFMTTGCAQFQAALEAAEATQQEFEAAGAELRQAVEVAERAQERYITALEKGDADKAAAALAALKAAEEERRRKELDFDHTQVAWKQAEKRLEDARKADNYVETLIGTIIGGIFGVGGGFFGGAKSGKRKALEEAKKS
jgi:hypothetical protein